MSRCLFYTSTASRNGGATLVVARGWAGTRPTPTVAGLTKWTFSYVYQALRHLLGPSLLVVYSLCGLTPLTAQVHDTRPGTVSVCSGFVVLPTGRAVLSQAEAPISHHSAPGAQSRHMGHTDSHSVPATAHHHTSHTAQGERTDPQLMGYQHRQAISPQPGMLCVPLGSIDATAWMATSHDATLQVVAESLQGVLTHNSRTNEALALTFARGGTPFQPSQVRVLVRMPYHDHRMPGGHGTANDPDVQGFVVQRHEQGRYLVPTVDFSMPGPWLFEIQLQDGTTTSRAYFAVDVGEQ